MTAAGDDRKAKVLIVDDEPSITSVVSRQLTRDGFACLEASSGEKALAAMEEDSFDVVTLFEVIEQLRANTGAENIVGVRPTSHGDSLYLARPIKITDGA